MTERQAVLCPYCGAEMRMAHNIGHGEFEVRYYCPECNSRSPLITDDDLEDAKIAAYEAAMQRAQEPNRVLTLEELREMDGDSLIVAEWRYAKTPIEASFVWWILARNWIFSFRDESKNKRIEDMYGVTVRCWLRHPTDAERGAAAWG